MEAHFNNDMAPEQIVGLLWKNTAILPEQKTGLREVVSKMKGEYTARPNANGGVIDKFGKAIRQIMMLSNEVFLTQLEEANREIEERAPEVDLIEAKYADEIEALLGKMESRDRSRDRVRANLNGSKGITIGTRDLARTLHARTRDLKADPDTEKIVKRILQGLN